MTVTITKLYDTYEQAREAVRDLEASGIPHSDISIVAGNAEGREIHKDHSGAAKGATTGAILGGAAGLLAGLGMLAIPGIGPVVAAGWLTTAIVGAGVGAGTGGVLGSLTDHGVPAEHAHVYAEGIRRGGALVAAKVPDDRRAAAESILARHKFVDPVARGALYRQSGWTEFNPAAQPYTPAQIEEERARYRNM